MHLPSRQAGGRALTCCGAAAAALRGCLPAGPLSAWPPRWWPPGRWPPLHTSGAAAPTSCCRCRLQPRRRERGAAGGLLSACLPRCTSASSCMHALHPPTCIALHHGAGQQVPRPLRLLLPIVHPSEIGCLIDGVQPAGRRQRRQLSAQRAHHRQAGGAGVAAHPLLRLAPAARGVVCREALPGRGEPCG